MASPNKPAPNPPASNATSGAAPFRHFWIFAACLAALLLVLFHRGLNPDLVQFSNDAPLGAYSVKWMSLPEGFTGLWIDSNSIGSSGGNAPLSLSSLLRMGLGALWYSKIFVPIVLWFFGCSAWLFFRSLKLSSWACALGALAAMLNSCYFSGACWGVGTQEIAFGANFLAMGLIMSNGVETPWRLRWLRLALAGMCVGINIMEAADIGALFSMFIALVVMVKTLLESGGNFLTRAARGCARVAVVAGFAGFLACQSVVGLIGSQVQGIAGTKQDSETKAQHWDWATQWSLPKLETIGLVVPGVFGYKMNTPQDMIPMFQESYQGGVYWGGMGRSPEIDRWLDSGKTDEPQPQGFMRFSGGGGYCGIVVTLLALWAASQLFRKHNSPFSDLQRKFIWFWVVVLVVSLLLAWGRFAPMFYGALYQLPYFSTIRNPAKFLIFFSMALIVLSAYGVHALGRRHLDAAGPGGSGFMSQLSLWWARVGAFDRKWALAVVGAFGASVLGWFIYASQKAGLVNYLLRMGFPERDSATQIANFSIGQAGLFLVFFGAAIALLLLAMAGYFNGPRAKVGMLLIGGLLVLDLVRANLPYINHWDYKNKYEVGALNPVVNFLREKPYEHRVTGLPFNAPQEVALFDQLYRIEWMQHHFLYYDIQTLDIIQMPRMPADLKAYLEALSPDGSPESAMRIARRWQLTNTRYLLGPAGYLEVMNQQLDPAQKRFRIAEQFEVEPKPGIVQPTRLEELTAVAKAGGRYALFEFTGALPRVKLYGNWQVNTNDQENLATLANLNFDPAQTVLVSTPAKNLPVVSTNANTGTVEFKSYAPKRIEFAANATVPSILLLNDRYDANWRVTVDGQPAELLRCNYLMRGVWLPPGQHTVRFEFSMPSKPLYITLAALVLAGLLVVLLIFMQGRRTD